MIRICLTTVYLLAFANVGVCEEPWRLVWSDEFEKSGAPDAEKWGYEEGFIRNKEAQYYTLDRRENARVEDGKLIIEARKESWRNPGFKKGDTNWKKGREFANYTSASLTTEGKASWTYGKIEVRAKMPGGKGTWPAIWTLGNNIRHVGWPQCGEIDILEFVGHEPNTVFANVHCGKYNHNRGNGKGHALTIKDPSIAFHIYTLEWHPDRLDLFVDGTMHLTYKDEATGSDAWPFDKRQYLILNLAIGGAWGGQQGIDDSIFPQRHEIDYVRVYQQK